MYKLSFISIGALIALQYFSIVESQMPERRVTNFTVEFEDNPYVQSIKMSPVDGTVETQINFEGNQLPSFEMLIKKNGGDWQLMNMSICDAMKQYGIPPMPANQECFMDISGEVSIVGWAFPSIMQFNMNSMMMMMDPGNYQLQIKMSNKANGTMAKINASFQYD